MIFVSKLKQYLQSGWRFSAPKYINQLSPMIDTRDKEVIKNIQAKTEIINKLEDKASKVLVLQLGSYTIKMGFANEKVPFVIKPFVAYRKNPHKNQDHPDQDASQEPSNKQDDCDMTVFKKQYNQIETYLKAQGIISAEHRPIKGKPRGKQNIPLNPYPDSYPTKDILCSEQALIVEDCPDEFIFRKPICHGQLNIKDNSAQEIQNCLNDLEYLLKYMLKQKMKIPEKEWKTFSCIIVVPDVFIRLHIKQLISMIFVKVGFNRIYMHLESVLACLGTAVSSALVVDIGHEKINVCCVDEGVILPKTLVRKNFGLKHISKTMIKLFNNKINEEGFDLSVSSETDLGQIDQIKELSCSVKQPQENSNKVYQMKTFRSKKIVQIPINYNDVMCISANSIFFNIWNAFPFGAIYADAFNSYSDLYDLCHDPEDLYEEFSGGGHVYEIQEENLAFAKEIADPFIYHPLEEIIAASLFSIKDPEARRKFLTGILVIGGGGLLPQLSEELVVRLNKIFETAQSEEKAECVTDYFVKEINLSHSSWLGGTVLPKLDSLRDLWIERSKYMGCMKEQSNEVEEEGALDKKLFTRKQESQEWGIRYLKEKIPFLW